MKRTPDQIESDVQSIMDAARGMPGHWFASRVGEVLHPGVNYRGVGKRDIARMLLEGAYGHRSGAVPVADVIEQVARAREERERYEEDRRNAQERRAVRAAKIQADREKAEAVASELRAVGIKSAAEGRGRRVILSLEDARRLLDDRKARGRS